MLNAKRKKDRLTVRLGRFLIEAATLAATADVRNFLSPLFIPLLTLIVLTFPVFFFACGSLEIPENDTVETKVCLDISESVRITSLDIFFFNNDRLGRLDSYQRIENPDIHRIQTASRAGEKRLVIIANYPGNMFTWARVNSYEQLCTEIAELKNENPANPLMSGETMLTAGATRWCNLSLAPLLARITVRRITCDFNGRPYSGMEMENVRIYLTNVSSRCRIVCPEKSNADSFINLGRFSDSDVSEFRSPGILKRDIPQPIGEKGLATDARLYCYPNDSEETGLGIPPSRLVIEGSIEGRTYYYPIDINRPSSGDSPPGISRNRNYVFDIKITRRGTDDPDTPISIKDMEVALDIRPWEERENITIIY